MSQLLVIEDDVAVPDFLQLAPRTLGLPVPTGGTGEDGLAFAHLHRASLDLAVVDVMLPGVDGFEFCRRLSTAGALPIVLPRGRSVPIDVVGALEGGPDHYVVKPVEPRVLDARI